MSGAQIMGQGSWVNREEDIERQEAWDVGLEGASGASRDARLTCPWSGEKTTEKA